MSLQDHFSIPENIVYLNTGTMAYSPLSVREALSNHKARLEDNPAWGLFTAWPRMWESQKTLAGYLKADPKNLFLRPNVTHAMNDFIMALKLPKGSEILISDLEYGAVVNICRYKAEKEGHEVKVFHIPARGAEARELTRASLLERFEKALTPKTRLVMFSHIMTGNGFVMPIEDVAALCRRRGIFFAVDGVHGAGAVPLDFSKSAVDFYGSNLHKWMMGPKGTGFGFVAPQVREHLEPRFAGWTTYDVQPHFEVFGEGDPWTNRWMICSTFNFADYYAITDVVKFWAEIGAEKIWKRQKALRDYAAKTVTSKLGWTCLSETAPEFRGPMVTFEVPDPMAEKGFELIFMMAQKHNLQVSMTPVQGRWCLRLAPHIYNAEDDIDRAASILLEYK